MSFVITLKVSVKHKLNKDNLWHLWSSVKRQSYVMIYMIVEVNYQRKQLICYNSGLMMKKEIYILTTNSVRRYVLKLV